MNIATDLLGLGVLRAANNTPLGVIRALYIAAVGGSQRLLAVVEGRNGVLSDNWSLHELKLTYPAHPASFDPACRELTAEIRQALEANPP